MIKTLAISAAALLLGANAALADSAVVSTNPPVYANGTNSQSMTPTGGTRVQPQDGAGHDVSSSHPLPVSSTTTPSASATTNGASTITTGGTFQTIKTASTSRKSLEFQNVCNKSGNCTATTNNCYLYIAASGSGTTANSIIVGPGQDYLRSNGSIPSDAISATCDGTGDHFYLATQ